jgi:hypothetical protein
MQAVEQCSTCSAKSIYERFTIEEAKERLRAGTEPPWANLDAGILPIVKILYEEGIETYESCQGGPGHPFPDPTVRFHGGVSEGFRALSVALTYNLRPTNLRRVYDIIDKECVGPHWEITFDVPGCPGWYERAYSTAISLSESPLDIQSTADNH